MGHVQNVVHAEYQRKAERKQRVDAADHQAVENLLRDHVAPDPGRVCAGRRPAEASLEI
jgi:hypothetical protein